MIKLDLPLAGMRSGRLTALVRHGNKWLCKCDCENFHLVSTYDLLSRHPHVRSCGCLNRDRRKQYGDTNWQTHGKTGTPEHRIWKGMKTRCNNPNATSYKYYGGRGIKVCKRWLDSFENFYADMGDKPTPHHTLDRISNDGNYCKSNCRWATMKEQAANKRR